MGEATNGSPSCVRGPGAKEVRVPGDRVSPPFFAGPHSSRLSPETVQSHGAFNPSAASLLCTPTSLLSLHLVTVPIPAPHSPPDSPPLTRRP